MIRDLIRNKLNNQVPDRNSLEKYFKYNLVVVIIMYIVSAIFLFRLPSTIPILHDGAKEIYVHSYVGVFLIPTIALIVNVMLVKQKRLSRYYTLLYVIGLCGMTIYYYTLI